MLNPEHIPVGRLKQAYRLNTQNVDDLLRSLWPNDIFPYEIWNKAYCDRWLSFAAGNIIKYRLDKSIIPEGEIVPANYDYFPIPIYTLDMHVLFIKLSKILFSEHLKFGLDYILSNVYDEYNENINKKTALLLESLSAIENKIIVNKYSNAQATQEQYEEIFQEKYCIPKNYYSFIESLYYDSITINIFAAVRRLEDWKYPFRQEVKGLPYSLVQRILAAQPQENPVKTEVTPVPAQKDDPENPPAEVAIIIPRDLWQGKEHSAVVQAMRDRKDKDCVIAHVLFERCGLTNKIEIGRLLRGHEERIQDNSTYSKHATACLKEASAFRIDFL